MSSVNAKNPANVAGGLKAAMHNPKVSEAAKESSAQRLQNMGDELDSFTKEDHAPGANHQFGGHKATLKNPKASEEAKEHSAQILREADVEQ